MSVGCPRVSADVRGCPRPPRPQYRPLPNRACPRPRGQNNVFCWATHVGHARLPALDPYTLNPKPSYQNPSRADGGNLAVPQLLLEQGSLPTPPARATMPASDVRECPAGGCENGIRKKPLLANGRRSYKIQFCENLIGLRSTYKLLISYL